MIEPDMQGAARAARAVLAGEEIVGVTRETVAALAVIAAGMATVLAGDKAEDLLRKLGAVEP